MSALNTFLFEEIAKGPLVNKDSIKYPTKKHKNASGAYVRIAYRKGRYGQTEGRVLGDIKGHIPACPYHMPRNIKRFNEPHLHISKKVLGDIIEAKDINNLIDKIRLFKYAWEAEANNIYGYNAVTGYPNAKVDISKLTYIESAGAPQPAFNIHDSKISGTIQNQIPTVANIFSCGGSSLASVVSQLNTAVANKTKTFTSFGTVLHHGFPEFMDDLNSYDNHTLIHAGHSPIVGVKAIQYMEAGKVSPNFKLQYLSGDKVADGGTENGHVKGKDNQDMIFNYNTAYVISYLQDNQPNTQPKYYGFILYYLGNNIVNNLPETEIVTEKDITYKKGIYFVGEKSYPQIKTADFKNIKNVLSKFITNIITLSQSQINNGTSDSETYQELSTFLSNQAAGSGTYDPEDPDTSFEGYDIRQNGLIKLNFYNILVDAYKLIINGCICNTDCACNLVCACNTNCGCNYDD